MESFDYIVVGAGTAGCVLASRLSQDPAARVLLLEAGSAHPPEAVAVPPAWPSLMGGPADWADTTVPQQATGAAVAWPRGRGLGGSSAINGMNFVRGHRSSYDAWDSAGATGWGFDELLPYFRLSENVSGRDPQVRGTQGPLNVGPAATRHPVAAAGLRAALEAGHRPASDISSGLEEGFGWCDLSIVDGRRQNAADAYLAPVLARRNLRVITDAVVHRVIVDRGRCTGVEYRAGGRLFTAHCVGETVLAAGAVGSPHLLLLSGVGPASQLQQAGVDTVVDLPGVGENLHDHPMSGIVYRSARPVPPGANNHGEALGLLRSSPFVKAPDIQVMFVDVPLREDRLPGPELGQGYTIAVSLMTPRSRGSVRLAGSDPGGPPVIDPRYCTEDADVIAMVAGLRAAREIGSAPAFDPWRAGEDLPGPATVGDQEWRTYLRRNLRSYSHPGGTCRMGHDETAVVDTDLRVHGVTGLRVVDASVMPSPVSANTNATVYAIAERAAAVLAGLT
ncbi:GMC family oxidoreductase [Actinacidiphila glaucinigra]|uniref:GMC family oxidoreductase n=1 Tax=Actinacidiphila glaucinigra TaxID=235986 RepID=UPI00366E52D4